MNTSEHPRVAVFPGQFDPITLGHLDVIRRGVRLFDELIVAVGRNPEKREMFPLEDRLEMISELLVSIPGARAAKYDGLTVDFVRSVKAAFLLRGIRDASDIRYEFQLALANRAVGGVETVFIMTGEQHAMTSSSLIRQVVALGAGAEKLENLVPPNVVARLRRMAWNPGTRRAMIDTPPV
jgi:pantetheine-phosphate adenylyltransferase